MKTNDEEVAEMVADITRIANMDDECDRASAATIALAETWLRLAIEATPQGSWERPGVSANSLREVTAEWYGDPRHLTLWFGEDGAQYLKSWGKNIVTEMEDGELTKDGLVALLRWLRGDEAGDP